MSTKLIISKTIAEIQHYNNDFDVPPNTKFIKHNKHLDNTPQTWDYYLSKMEDILIQKNTVSSTQRRARRALRRLLASNFIPGKTSFLTLTFAQKQADRHFVINEFQKFMKRLSYHLYKAKKNQVPYVLSLEQHKKGGYHIHCVLFGVPFIPSKEVEKIWGHGFIKIVGVFSGILHLSNYTSKYFLKQKTYGVHRYSCAKKMKRPLVLYVSEAFFQFFSKNIRETKFEYISKDYRYYYSLVVLKC